MAVIAWTEIEAFYNIRKYAAAHPEILNGQSGVHYKSKVKLHGTNAGIQCHADGRVIAQSRTSELVEEADNAGFAKWVKDHEDFWKVNSFVPLKRANMIIFGEWIGPGIQKNVAVSQIPKKCFVIFAARSMDTSMSDNLITDPMHLSLMVEGIPDTYVLPWHSMPDQRADAELTIDWTKTPEELTTHTNLINKWVDSIEVNDPWVEATFGVKGTGEGLVFYPVSKEHQGLANFNNLVFKAKGEKHKNIKTAAPAQVNPEVAASIGQFVDMVLTEARLEQGATAVQSDQVVTALTFDVKLVGKFIAWVVADVQKETQDELEASKLDWKQVQKPLSEKARNWYLAKARV